MRLVFSLLLFLVFAHSKSIDALDKWVEVHKELSIQTQIVSFKKIQILQKIYFISLSESLFEHLRRLKLMYVDVQMQELQ
ncbi:hypothetical protein CCZ01_09220 [Helicobacter monodelphidis]|uniref:hypothetical protein n=1 Tax=Helicobacter sp. 15-1451 TaxID=2004995 RepID=UPI000DCDE267|nr:hypothetical protein [Helicobacter sp. 15-1451]RAX56544.1 hypothetical protein CCZ01_09220 [Helicobacter sp. 15-1451]